MNPHYMARHRATDNPNHGRLWVLFRRLYLVWVAFIPAVAVFVALVAVVRVEDAVQANEEAIALVNKEGAERQDQVCVAFERDAQTAIRFYRDARRIYFNTRQYLDSLDERQSGEFLNTVIRDRIPRLRAEVHQRHAEAKAAAAPPFCDEPDVGLPEPNSFLPEQALP